MDLRISSAAHLLHHRMRNLATLGFPVPDTDHQKHALGFDETLSAARLYIAIWMQAFVTRQRATKPAHPKQGSV